MRENGIARRRGVKLASLRWRAVGKENSMKYETSGVSMIKRAATSAARRCGVISIAEVSWRGKQAWRWLGKE